MAHYKLEELDFKDFGEAEQIRTRKIFEDLREKALNKAPFLEREKDFVCMCLKLSDLDENPEDFEICNDYIFKELYLTYFHNNLSGPFYKAKEGQLVEVTDQEKFKDFATLMNISDSWHKQIMIDNHKEAVIQELSIEARRDLKNLDLKYPPLLKFFRRHQDDYRLKKDKIILQSKFIYLLVKSIIENNNPEDFEIPFSGQTIEFTIYSLVHIASRHYAEPIKDNPDKTYHYDHFYPTELHIDLKNILLEIDSLNRINISKTDNINFKFKDVVYSLWIQKRFKQVKGKGNVEIYRVQTFYPIYSKPEINKLDENYDKVALNEELSVFISK